MIYILGFIFDVVLVFCMICIAKLIYFRKIDKNKDIFYSFNYHIMHNLLKKAFAIAIFSYLCPLK